MVTILLGAPDNDQGANPALAKLGEAVGVDRTYIFRNRTEPETDRLLVRLSVEMGRQGMTPHWRSAPARIPYDLFGDAILPRFQNHERAMGRSSTWTGFCAASSG